MPPTVRSRRTSSRGRVRHGFSLIELLVVITIMALLSSIAMPLAELSHQCTREEDLRRSLRQIRNALDTYKRLVDEGRIERAADGSGYPPSLEMLVQGVTDARSPQRVQLYLLRDLPRDPFALASIAAAADTWAVRSFASPPDDPKPGKDVFDVHSKSTATGLNGLPYRKW